MFYVFLYFIKFFSPHYGGGFEEGVTFSLIIIKGGHDSKKVEKHYRVTYIERLRRDDSALYVTHDAWKYESESLYNYSICTYTCMNEIHLANSYNVSYESRCKTN